MALVRLPVNLTKKGSNKLYKRGQPSGLGQIAVDDVEMRRHSCPAASVSPRGQDECSVANGNRPRPRLFANAIEADMGMRLSASRASCCSAFAGCSPAARSCPSIALEKS